MCKVSVRDESGNFSETDLEALGQYVRDEILSTVQDIGWLVEITIEEAYRSGWNGYWIADIEEDLTNVETVKIEAFIVLNSFYLKTLDQLKKTLTHEYGHHWTISYLAFNYGLRKHWLERLPHEYYWLRRLNPFIFACDDSNGWKCCDKEVIAEDYRVLCSPFSDPDQRMPPLSSATEKEDIKDYIQNLQFKK